MVRSADSVDQNHQIIMKTNLSTYLYLILSRIHRIHRELGKMRCQQILWRPLLRRPFLVTISSGDLRYPCSPQFSHADHSWFVAKSLTFEHTDLYIHSVPFFKRFTQIHHPKGCHVFGNMAANINNSWIKQLINKKIHLVLPGSPWMPWWESKMGRDGDIMRHCKLWNDIIITYSRHYTMMMMIDVDRWL